MSKATTKRAQAIVTRATALFSEYADADGMILPGHYLVSYQGGTVSLSMDDEGSTKLTIVGFEDEDEHDNPATTAVVMFEASWKQGAPIGVTQWHAGSWERVLTASQA